jgi:hypothetical protein
MDKLQKLFAEVKTLSTEELRQLNQFVVATVKEKRNTQSFQIGANLRVGMTVTIDNARFRNDKFTVSKVNRTKAVLTHLNSKTDYNVPLSMIILDK